jgi:energy-coupling factor transport system permease protein
MALSELSENSSGQMPRAMLAGMDPRVRLVIFALLLVAVFSARAVWRLAALSLLASVILALVPVFAGLVGRRIARLRWLFAVTLAMHLLFGSGHTLFGLAWLSRDGLVQGAIVVWRLVLAMFFASLLCWSSTPESLVTGGLGLVQPLKKLPLRAIGRHLLLVLYWAPVVQEEILAVWRRGGVAPVAWWRCGPALLADLIKRLAAKAEALADDMMAGERQVEPRFPPPLLCRGGKERVTLLLVAVAAVAWFGVLP